MQSGDIMQYFPLPVPRAGQIRALQYVQDVIAKGYRDVVLELPTGAGKTAIGSTIAAWARAHLRLDAKIEPGAYQLVLQKALQDQIEAELNRLGGKTTAALIKSSVEYACPHFKRCSAGMLRKCACLKDGECAYKIAKAQFMGATVAITNYAYFFIERKYAGQIQPRHVLVLDEVHNLPRTLLKHVDVQVSEATLDRFAPDVPAGDLRSIRTMTEFQHWLEDEYLPAATSQRDLLLALNDSDENVKEAQESGQHVLKIEAFIERSMAQPNGWVFWDEEDRDRKVILTARPLDAAPYFNELVGSAAPVRIHMSAYPGPKAVYCRELGLDPTRVAWLRLQSTFAPERRPVSLLGLGSLSRQNQADNLPGAMRLLVKIVQAHAHDRGVIHTHSYKLAEAAVAALKATGLGNRVICPKSADEREAALKQHAATPGAILVSPSVGEGFDFRDDLARFQVVLKSPFPSLGDRHVAALAERDPEWYRVETAKAFLQMCGRVCRSESDSGKTYCLDLDINRLLKETRHELPRWFKAAIFLPDGTPFFEDAAC